MDASRVTRARGYSSAMSNRTVLVVEEAQIAQIVAQCAIDEGFEVVVAYSDADALALCQYRKPWLAIIGETKQGFGGHGLLKRIRIETVGTEDMPTILLLFSDPFKDDIMQYYRWGADMCLTKPFDPLELSNFIRRLAEPVDECKVYKL